MKTDCVWVLVARSRWSEDEVRVFHRRRDAEVAALSYAHECWPEDAGPPPATYAQAVSAWEREEVWGAADSRWEIQCLTVEGTLERRVRMKPATRERRTPPSAGGGSNR